MSNLWKSDPFTDGSTGVTMADIPIINQGKGRSGSDSNLLREAEISPELIQEIADKVYLLLIQRLQIERERTHSYEYDY